MSKLLFVFERDMPTVSITRNVFSNLKHFPEIQSNFMYLTDVTSKDIDDNDVIIFIRPMYQYAWRIAKRAREAGHTTVSFCDDDLLNLPRMIPTIPWRRKCLLNTLHYSDVIWSTSRYILQQYKELTGGKRTAYCDTIVSEDEFAGENVHNGAENRVRIVYAAAGSHASLFENNIKPIVTNLFEEFGDMISFTFVGVHPEMGNYPCEYIPSMPLMQYRKYMKESRFDIGLAPLNEDEFSKRKYFNKFIEYTTQGIMGIYTKTEPYTYVVKDGINGFLTENKPDKWFEAICKAVQNKDLRQKCVKNAVMYLREYHSEQAVFSRFLTDLPEAMNANHKYRRCKHFEVYKSLYYISRMFDWLYLTLFYLKNTGLKNVIARSIVHLKGHAYSKGAK